ncbi:unnamed protein product, partial [marine sediment metagenome]
MTSRDAILQRIRAELAGSDQRFASVPAVDPPPV